MEELLSNDIPVTIIPDTSVAHLMSDVDLVLIGAVAVVENGGILNSVCLFSASVAHTGLDRNLPDQSRRLRPQHSRLLCRAEF